MERPPVDPRKLQATWTGWVAAESTPGRVVADFKTGGLRDILEHWSSEPQADEAAGADALLAAWMKWERGELVPEALLSDLAAGGLAERLTVLAAGTTIGAGPT